MDFEASLVDVYIFCIVVIWLDLPIYHYVITLFACNSFLSSGFYYSLVLSTFRHFTIPEFFINVCIIYLFPLYYFQPIYVVELSLLFCLEELFCMGFCLFIWVFLSFFFFHSVHF